MSEILVHVMRNGMVESIHRGDLVVVDDGGKIIYSLGDPHKRTYWRSAAKPFQAVPLVESGGMEQYGFTDEELAFMCSSHNGEEKHRKACLSILHKTGLDPSNLACGTAPPMHQKTANLLLQSGESFSALTNGCSGKHAAMLALARLRGYDLHNYTDRLHPVQLEMRDCIADCARTRVGGLSLGTDGCGVPVFGLPLYHMALAYLGVARPHKYFSEKRAEALKRVAAAMTAHPFYVAGTGRLDTAIMEATGGRILAKMGAEGVYCLCDLAQGIALAMKVEDGNGRAVAPAVTAVLEKLQLISMKEAESLAGFRYPQLKNHRGEVVGHILTAF